ncbi:hypothetical protein [Iodobacter sp.]|uniref:hypothetical protein n=1 Tax=Iodobacter sp. TaxID=1915058 RepID=UPI0025E4BD31|nr:hypothetical protein [Iodobacter sp.]
MSKSILKKYALAQAIVFWLFIISGILVAWSVISGAPSSVFYALFFAQLSLWLVFIIASCLLANAVNESPFVWGIISFLFGPIGFILAYVRLSSKARSIQKNHGARSYL